jgi:hypothetical protein
MITYHHVKVDTDLSKSPVMDLIRDHIGEVMPLFGISRAAGEDFASSAQEVGVNFIALTEHKEVVGYLSVVETRDIRTCHAYIKPEFRGGAVLRGLLRLARQKVNISGMPISIMSKNGKSIVTRKLEGVKWQTR